MTQEPEKNIVERRAFFVYFFATLTLLAYILQPFAVTMMVASVIAVLLGPVYNLALEKYPKPRTASAILTGATIVLVLAPIAWVTGTAIAQAADVAESIKSMIENPQQLGFLTPYLEQITATVGMNLDELIAQLQLNAEQGAGQFLKTLGQGAKKTLGATAALFLNFFILIIAIYTFLIHSGFILKKFKQISPLDDELEDKLIKIFRGFSYGIVLGGFVTAVIQGIVAGIGYAIFGASDAFFWGFLTGMFSFVPFVGTALVWIPIAAMLLAKGSTSAAIGLAVYSILITGSVDNFVKPWLIGQNSSLNPLMLFLSIFGGLITLGAAGILIGPVATSFFLALVEVYEEQTSNNFKAETG